MVFSFNDLQVVVRTPRPRTLLHLASVFGLSARIPCASYKEFPFIVRRRNEGDPGERARITGELAAVQRQLSNSLALIQVESPKVAERYEELVRQLREVAGGEIRRSWELPPTPADASQSIEDIDLSRLLP